MVKDIELSRLPGQVSEQFENLVAEGASGVSNSSPLCVSVQTLITPQSHTDEVDGSFLDSVQVFLESLYQRVSVDLQSLQKVWKVLFLIELVLRSFQLLDFFRLR